MIHRPIMPPRTHPETILRGSVLGYLFRLFGDIATSVFVALVRFGLQIRGAPCQRFFFSVDFMNDKENVLAEEKLSLLASNLKMERHKVAAS